MKSLPQRRLHLAWFAAALGLAVVAAPMAQAFTIDDKSNTNSDGSAKYVEPNTGLTSGKNGQSTIRNGNATFQFGPAQQRSFDDRTAVDRMFNPNGRPNDGR